jgi:hypothetical protein
MSTAAEDDRWQSAYENAAERLSGKTAPCVLTAEEDEACIAEANYEVTDEAWHQGQEG